MGGEKRDEKERQEQAILRRMKRLADGRVNDAVKLAFLEGEQTSEIDKLDLMELTEFKRNGNGTVEIRLLDRVALLEKMLALVEKQKDQAEEFFLELGRGDEDEGGGSEA